MDSTAQLLYAGVDVSKTRLDVSCVRRGKTTEHEAFSVSNDAAGIDALVGRLVEARSALVVLEATGGFECAAVAAALAAAELPVAVVTTLARCATSPGPRGASPKPIA